MKISNQRLQPNMKFYPRTLILIQVLFLWLDSDNDYLQLSDLLLNEWQTNAHNIIMVSSTPVQLYHRLLYWGFL